MPCINDCLAQLATCRRLAGQKIDVYWFWQANSQAFIQSWNMIRSMKQTHNVFFVWYGAAHFEDFHDLNEDFPDENEDAPI